MPSIIPTHVATWSRNRSRICRRSHPAEGGSQCLSLNTLPAFFILVLATFAASKRLAHLWQSIVSWKTLLAILTTWNGLHLILWKRTSFLCVRTAHKMIKIFSKAFLLTLLYQCLLYQIYSSKSVKGTLEFKRLGKWESIAFYALTARYLLINKLSKFC